MITIFDLHADIFKVLANKKRLEIIHLIRDRELTVKEMAEMLDMRQPNVSQQLMVLRDHKIVKTRKDSTKIYYSLTDINLLKASDLIREFLRDTHKGTRIEGTFSEEMKLEDYLKEHRDPVCGMYVSAKVSAGKENYKNVDYYFCAEGCKKKFKKDPKFFLEKGEKNG